jgi:glycosyltransferase involved in cell wall biosynthesis
LKIVIVENTRRIIPAGLNRAIEVSMSDMIIRLDAHSEPYPDYVALCVAALGAQDVDNVGGMWDIRTLSDGWIAKGIAAAARHPLGVGDALYRIGGKAQEVETVPFGAFRKELWERIGHYNENLLANEDYEFNTRIRQAGGKVWFDPAIRSVYYSRQSVLELARQYGRYGYWKARMLRLFPGTIRWRQFLPPAFVMGVIILLLSGIIFKSAWILLLAGLLAYILLLGLASLKPAVRIKDFRLVLSIPLAIATMHMSWGTSFLWSLISFHGKK